MKQLKQKIERLSYNIQHIPVMESDISDITRCFCDYLYYQENKHDDSSFHVILREQKEASEQTDFDSFSDVKQKIVCVDL